MFFFFFPLSFLLFESFEAEYFLDIFPVKLACVELRRKTLYQTAKRQRGRDRKRETSNLFNEVVLAETVVQRRGILLCFLKIYIFLAFFWLYWTDMVIERQEINGKESGEDTQK